MPLIIYFPELEEAGKRINLLARSIDIFPTALGLLGIAPPPKIHGKDLILLADSGRGAGFAYSELEPFLAPQKFIKAFQEEDYKLILNLSSSKSQRVFRKNDGFGKELPSGEGKKATSPSFYQKDFKISRIYPLIVR